MAININGRVISKGSRITFNDKAYNYIPGVHTGMSVTVHRIRSKDTIGLYSGSNPVSGWGDLDELVDHGHGWWISASELAKCMLGKDDGQYRVEKSINYRGMDLEGKEGKIVAYLDSGDTVFLELDENVGGCSADGLGKTGHCVPLPTKVLKKLPSKEAAKSKSKKE